MSKRALILAAAAFAASAAAILPASADTDMPLRGAVMFWFLDRNDNGSIDKPEIEALRGAIFDAADENSDGRVTRDEFVDVFDAVGDFRQEREHWGHGGWREGSESREGPRGPKFSQRHDGPHKVDIAERLIERLGIDADGGLAKGDFVSREPKVFARADEDHDGSVSRREFEKAGARIGHLMMME